MQELPADARAELLHLAQGRRRRRRLAGLGQRPVADPPQELERLGGDQQAATARDLGPALARSLASASAPVLHVAAAAAAAGEAQERLAAHRQHRPSGERGAALRAGVGRGEDASQAQHPALEVARRHVLVRPREQRLERRVEQPEQQIGALVLLRELEHVVGEVAAEQDAFEVRLQAMDRPHQVDPGDPHQVAPLLLEPGDLHLGERLQLAGEAAVAGARAPRHAALLAALAGQEGDDPVAVVQVADVQHQGLRGVQAHDQRTPSLPGAGVMEKHGERREATTWRC